ncbi:PepSY-associated TM helix domain-containing protein [Roseateles sp. DC23W]|uniref:PepSY-associated TM helix domain-containing protein n=1 Tax=Pelomonas dachongensis TaxID=3299029 RepID=A0ABW7EUQ5_9BURK
MSTTSSAALNRLFWRLHFWAGLISSPIILFAALTGLLYVFTPQIEAWRHADVDRVTVSSQRLPLDAQVQAALAAAPDAALRYVVPAHAADDSTQVWLRAPHAHHGAGGEHDHGLPTGSIVYVNPYTGQVLGQLQEMERFKTWAKKLHSTALQGDGWRWLIELGASWMLVLFATGLVMWWPRSQARGGDGWRALVPRWGRGRATWRDLHAVVAIALGLVLAVVLVTGLTWAEHSGKRFRDMQRALAQDAPRAPKGLQSTATEAPPLSWEAAYEKARSRAPDIAMQLTPPAGERGVWRIENFDRSQPTGRFSLVLDARSGATLFAGGWERLPALAQATAVGIPFHRGEFGVWNQVLLALAALAAVFSVVSGFVMWWQRRPRGKVAAPTLPARTLKAVPLWLWPLMAALGWAMPVFGWSLVAFIALEGLARIGRVRAA